MTVRCNGKQVVEGKLGRVCKPQSAGSPFSRSMISISLVPRYGMRFNAKSLGKSPAGGFTVLFLEKSWPDCTQSTRTKVMSPTAKLCMRCVASYLGHHGAIQMRWAASNRVRTFPEH
jgi:hypothetical protein